MKSVLVTGGTAFVSRFVATWFVEQGYKVYVLNRGTHPQVEGVTVICEDRHKIGDCLKGIHFDAVLDVTAYDEKDIKDLLDHVDSFDDYIFISSSAVYPETLQQPFIEEQPVGRNQIWGAYGMDKIGAEEYLLSQVPEAYILRPPYLYGPMQNLYREPFVFDCARSGRPFYLPNDGSMPLQFFHVEDLCRMMQKIMEVHPKDHIMNVGNEEVVDIKTFVRLCYEVVGAPLEEVYVTEYKNQREFFPFHEYAYALDVTKQKKLLGNLKDLKEGLKESYDWYVEHENEVIKRGYLSFIDRYFIKQESVEK